MPLKETSFYIKKEDLIRYNKLDERLFYTDLILLLLRVSPVRGNTKMQKEVFLLWKEVFPKQSADPIFYPYKYGAYSKVLQDSIKYLEKQGLITMQRRKGIGSLYKITEIGMEKIRERISKLGLDTKLVAEKKTDWEEWTHEGIKKYVYRRYPEFTDKTKREAFKW